MRRINIFAIGMSLATIATLAPAAHAAPGQVFTTTNAVDGNEVVVYNRSAAGQLSFAGNFSTGGNGTGGALGNQGAVVLSKGGHWLLAVNAGSDSVSVFSVQDDDLTLTDVEPSGGSQPVSVTIHGELVYVLNALDGGNISGFVLSDDGELEPLADSTRPLSGAAITDPAQIQFDPHGNFLVVTEKATDIIDTYAVDDDGLADGPSVQPSNGATPFGFNFNKQGYLFVSEAFGEAADASAVSSYKLDGDGQLHTRSASVPTTETAACWVAVTNNGRFVYTANTGSDTISGYKVKKSNGKLTLIGNGVRADTGDGSAPSDMGLSKGSKFLFVLNGATGEIVSFRVKKSNGKLTEVDRVDGLPVGVTGLASR